MTVIGYCSGFPAAGEATAGYLLQKDNCNLLIDCGSGVVSHLQKYINIAKLDAVILSHYHLDHCSDVGVLQYSWLIKTQLKEVNTTLPIYGHSKSDFFKYITMEPYTQGIEYREEDILNLGPYRIEFLKSSHPELCYAMKINDGQTTMVYTADTAYFSKLIDFAQDCDLLLAESSLFPGFEGERSGHMNSIEAASLARDANTKGLLLTHLPNYGDRSILLSKAKEIYKGEVLLAKSGLKWSSGNGFYL